MLIGLRDLVINAVDKGSNSMEGIHKSLANLPFKAVSKIGPLEAPANGLGEAMEESIGKAYDMTRNMFHQFGEITDNWLDKSKKKEETKAPEKPKLRSAKAKPKEDAEESLD